MGVPASGINAAVEPEPADGRHQYHRSDHTPDRDGADPAGDPRTAEVGEGGDPQQRDGRQAHL
ncbi:hypothetical protein D3C86_1289800 [compost metagenome]